MSIEPNPKNWPQDVKSLAQLAVLVITIIGSIGGLANYLGGEIYKFAEAQTMMAQQLRRVQTEMGDEKVALQDSNRQREVSINGLRTDITPRIDSLEKAIHAAENEAAASKQRADDMKEDLKQLKELAVRNLNVTESHDADIKATREAVAPKGTP